MKKMILPLLLLAGWNACRDAPREPAPQTALEAADRFLRHSSLGAFDKAGKLLLDAPGQEQKLRQAEARFRPGREQQTGQPASYRVLEIREPNDSILILYYQLHTAPTADSLRVVRRQGRWQIELLN